MDKISQGIFYSQGYVFPGQQKSFEQLKRDGQQVSALMIARIESRVLSEQITESGSGDLFVCRNAGNIAPPYAQRNGGVPPAIARPRATSAMAA